MRNKLGASLLALALIAAACGSSDPDNESATGPLSELGDNEDSVVIVAWAGYIERGDTDPAFDWVTSFEAATGCSVEVKTAASSDEMVALMTGSDEFDLVTASGDASLRLIQGGTVQPINTDLIPSWNTVDERLQNAAWNTVDGVNYGTPYQWGTNVLAYNTDVWGDEIPDSWSVVFEETEYPDGQSNVGRIQAYDGPIYIADAALYLRATQPSLGIEDPYQLSEEQYAASLDLLRQQRELIGRYWHDAFIQIDDFTNEGVAASGSWPFQVNLLQGAGQPIASVVPVEGATGWADTTMLATNAPNPNCAYRWMEHSLSEATQGDLAAWFSSVPAVPSACVGNDLLGADGCEIRGINNFDRIDFWKTPTSDCNGTAAEGACVPYFRWVTDYLAVIGGR